MILRTHTKSLDDLVTHECEVALATSSSFCEDIENFVDVLVCGPCLFMIWKPYIPRTLLPHVLIHPDSFQYGPCKLA